MPKGFQVFFAYAQFFLGKFGNAHHFSGLGNLDITRHDSFSSVDVLAAAGSFHASALCDRIPFESRQSLVRSICTPTARTSGMMPSLYTLIVVRDALNSVNINAATDSAIRSSKRKLCGPRLLRIVSATTA